MIKVIVIGYEGDKGRGTFLRVHENQKMYQAFSLDGINTTVLLI